MLGCLRVSQDHSLLANLKLKSGCQGTGDWRSRVTSSQLSKSFGVSEKGTSWMLAA